MPRGVYTRKPRPKHPRTIRTLRSGEERPTGEPRRYYDSQGYVRLRWKVGVGAYVEAREHRVVADVPDALEVHHKDRDRDNNSPDNLEWLTRSEHAALHGRAARKFDVDEAARLYDAGYSTPAIGRLLGVDGSNVWRALHAIGHPMRRGREARPVLLDYLASVTA